MRKFSPGKNVILTRAALCGAILIIFSIFAEAQGNFTGKIDHPLRYHPENRDFVIENGKEFFNRPLYGGNTASRRDFDSLTGGYLDMKRIDILAGITLAYIVTISRTTKADNIYY